MEGQPMVSYSAGSVNSVVYKLTKLKDCSLVIEGLQKDLMILLESFSQVVVLPSKMNWQVQVCMKIVRELVFDIEDWIDQMPAMPNTGGKLVDLEDEVKRFKARIEHALSSELRDPASLPGHTQVTVASHILFEEKTALVGMEVPMDELVKHLTGEHEKRRKVVSILGVEGLGKTTLAKEVYSKIQGNFECRAFVTLGRRPSIRETVQEILCQVNPSAEKKINLKIDPRHGRGTAPDLKKLLTELWKYLATKRYFILVDGLWSTQAWKIINSALPNENNGSRVLTTTCISAVAQRCSVHPMDIYRIEPLNEEMSARLYLKLIRQKEWPADHAEVTKNMFKMCGGMPLALVLAAGLLAAKCKQLPEPEISVVSSVEQYSKSDGIMKTLQMSYDALSLPLRSCLLYLSVFRGGCTIKKDRLIRLWIAERLIPRKDDERRAQEIRGDGGEETRVEGGEIIGYEENGGKETGDEKSLWETGQLYFKELIIRRLIQPVFNYNDDQPVGCTVHGVILDFINSLSSKGNFVTVGGAHLSTDMVRRFSLDCFNNNDEDRDATLASFAMHLSRVRSMIVLGDIEGIAGRSALTLSGKIDGTPVLPSFKLLRVLDLEGTYHLRSRHLQGIGGLVLLRYLGAAETAIDSLPEEIGELGQLETLNLRKTKMPSTLPTSMAKQKMLAHLLIDGTVKLPSEILKMQGLEEVSTVGVYSSRSIDSVAELLRKSERLRVLGIRLDGSHLSNDNESVRTFLMEVTRMASLFSVTHLDIEIVRLEDEAVRALGGLPHLVLLKLVSSGGIRFSSQLKWNPEGRCKVGVDHGFKCVKVLSLICRSGGTELEFTPGAMKELQRLTLDFSAREALCIYGNFSFGIEHLSSLTRVHAMISCKCAVASEVNTVKDAIREQAGNLSSKPTIEFTTINEHMIIPDHKAKTAAVSPKIWLNGCINFRQTA
ncbi:Disease resistance protein RPM1 [Triticum urartu]|uniref:Disease resistance protein RPM1 n=1 Tax=Triticum urartu TaxID=4572 RepID=M8AD55_TRIUA|nr:Disease resistance protein RPM1 [Triticum urartu]